VRKVKYIAGAVIGLVLIGVLVYVSTYVFNRVGVLHMYSMFSWDSEVMDSEEKDRFISITKKMDIGSVYQSFPQDLLETDKMKDFISDLRKENVDVYYLTGEREWGLESDGSSFKAEIDKVAAYNDQVKTAEKIKGIVVDIEPYLTEEWDTADEEGKQTFFQIYADGMIEAYKYASEKEIPILVCVPNFYDKYWRDGFERLAANGCDGLAVMNYNREKEIEEIEGEIEIARKYDKDVIFIAELQRPGVHELVENNTYYYEGLAALKESFEKMGNYYNYDKLSYSYHYYKPLVELLEIEQ